MIEIARQPANDRLVACVSEAEAPAAESAEMLVGRDDHDGFAVFFGLHGGDHAGRSATVDDNIVLGRAESAREQTATKESSEPTNLG